MALVVVVVMAVAVVAQWPASPRRRPRRSRTWCLAWNPAVVPVVGAGGGGGGGRGEGEGNGCSVKVLSVVVVSKVGVRDNFENVM